MSARLAMEERGTGHPLVMLHGWGLNAAVWRECMVALDPSIRTIAIDLPGHGRSAWCDEAGSFAGQTKLIESSLPEGEFSLLGWSLGGLFAMALARKLPKRVRRLVLVSTTPKFVVSQGWPAGLASDTVRKFALHLATNYRGTVNDFLELQTRGSANAGETLAGLRAALRERGDAQPAALARGLDILETADLRPALPLVESRTLLVGGQYDRITPPAAMEQLHALLPRAQMTMVPRAAHAPFLSHSTIFAARIRTFLEDHA